MKTLGLLGGMSWESTELYYRAINQKTRDALGGLHSAPIAMVSVDFHEIEALQQRGEWDAAAVVLARSAQQVQAAGAEAVIQGCTEIVMLVQQRHTQVPLFDTTAIHADEAVAWALP